MFVGQTEGFFSKKRRNQLFNFAYDRHGKSDKEAFRNDMIGGSEIGPMTGPVNLIKSLREKFFPELLEYGIQRGLPSAPVEVCHREINDPDVAGNVDRLNRNPRRKEIELGWNGGDPGPVVEVENREDELSPSSGFDGCSRGVDPLPQAT